MSEQKQMMRQNIIDEIKIFCEQITYLEDLFELERELTPIGGGISCPDALDIINRALYDASFMTLSKLVADDDRRTRNIWNLLKQMKDNVHLFDEVKKELLNNIQRCEDELEADKSIIEKIRNRRNTIMAHNDEKYFAHPKKYTERIPNYELWSVSAKMKSFIDALVEKIGIDVSTKGRYCQSQDFREIIETNIFNLHKQPHSKNLGVS